MTEQTKTLDDQIEEKKRNDYKHATQSGIGWAESIEELHERWNAAEGDDEEEELRESTEQEVWEGPLSLEYRSGWVSCRDWHSGEAEAKEQREPCEYRILLGTGGPAVQLTGRFPGEFREAADWENDWELQVQDWFLPWRNIRHELTPEQRTAITWYIEMFIGHEF